MDFGFSSIIFFGLSSLYFEGTVERKRERSTGEDVLWIASGQNWTWAFALALWPEGCLLILALCAVCSSVRSLCKPTLLLRMPVEPERAYNKTSSPCFVWCLLWYVSSQECLTPAGKTRYSTQTFPRRSAKMPCWFCLGNQCWIAFRWGRIFSPHLAVQSDVLTLVSDVSLCIVIWTVHLFNNVGIL